METTGNQAVNDPGPSIGLNEQIADLRHRIKSAQSYISKCPPAVEGARNDGLNKLAYAVLERFDIVEPEYEALLLSWACQCSPPIPESEALKTLRSAWSGAHAKGAVGVKARPTSQHTARPATGAPAPKAVASPAKKYDLDESDLPEEIPDGARALLRSAFRPGECIGIARARLGDDGELPADGGGAMALGDWLTKLDEHDGNPNGVFYSSKKTGIYIRINPLKLGGTKDDDVTDYRHALLEFDSQLSVEQQFSLYRKANLPCAAIIFSGGKSVHAWVRVDAQNKREYNERVRVLYEHFESRGYKPDKANRNPSRFSRLPNCVRFDSRQQLLALNVGSNSFEEWCNEKDSPADTWPPIDDGETVANDDSPLPDEIVSGVLHRGCKGIVGGASKARKTWILIDLALSVATGKPFWRWQTKPGPVLYINFEIERTFIFRRVRAVANAKEVFAYPNLNIWTLRGYAAPMWRLMPDLMKRIAGRNYSLIVIDPVYKTLGGRDENSAGDIGELCNELDRLAQQTKAAVVYGAHYSKGNQASKSAMDRIGGSGVFARDADSIITLTQHKDEGAFVVDLILRNHPEQSPFVVQWGFPLMREVADADAHDLRQTKTGPAATYDADEILNIITDSGIEYADWRDEAEKSYGVSKATFDRVRKRLMKEKKIIKSVMDGKWKRAK